MVHILNEAASSPEALVWRMWCGDQCVAFDDGSTAPEKAEAERATCPRCRAVLSGQAREQVAPAGA